jgi:photosystem II stability/assembly factor-like uncharacterized protein
MKIKTLLLIIVVVLSGSSLIILGLSRKPSVSRAVCNAGPEKESGMGPNDWLAMQRAYPYGQIKLSSYLTGMAEAGKLQRASTKNRYNWTLAGPTNIGGRITDIAVPAGQPLTWYIGAATGGIFKTSDGGATWDNIFNGADVISIGDLAIDPTNDQVIYAGTGEANASSQSFFGDGIYKSTDAGMTWEHKGLEYSAYIGRIIVDYDNPQRVYAAACGNLFTPDENRGVYRSVDGGSTWERILFLTDSTSAVDLIQSPQDPDVLYATMWERMRGLSYRRSFGVSSGIYKTTNGGDTWQELTNGLPAGQETGRIGLDIALSNPQVMYAFYDMPDYEVRVYKSSNGGDTWVRKNDAYLQGMSSNFGWYFGQIRVDPSNENRIFVLGVYAYRSDNGGDSWSELGGYSFHVDHHALVIDESGTCLEGNDGGLYTSSNYGNTWNKVNNLPISQFYNIEIDYLYPQRILGGTQDNGTVRTITGSVDDWFDILGGDGFYCVVDYTNSNIIYAEYQWGGLNKSTNGGGSFQSIGYEMSGDRTNWSSPLVIDPQEHTVLYFGTYRVWKSLNSGSSWTVVSSDLTDGDDGSTWHTISTLAISPLDPAIVLAGTDDGHVHISLNNGTTWDEISEGLPKRWITCVAADPHDAATIYVTVSGFRWDEPLPHVFKSTDLGQTWMDISSNLPELPMNWIVIDPNYPGRLVVGSDAGVFYSLNSGENWTGISQGLGNVPVLAMKIHPPTRTLVIGTYGMSAYKISLDDISVGVEENNALSSSGLLLDFFPNPLNVTLNQQATVTYKLSKPAMVDLSVLDMNGRKVKTLRKGWSAGGLQVMHWDGSDDLGRKLPAGFLMVQLNINKQMEGKKIVIQ